MRAKEEEEEEGLEEEENRLGVLVLFWLFSVFGKLPLECHNWFIWLTS